MDPFFAGSFLNGAEIGEEYPNCINYQFYEKEDFIKLKRVLSEGVKAECKLCKINNPDSKGLAVEIKNDSLTSILAIQNTFLKQISSCVLEMIFSLDLLLGETLPYKYVRFFSKP